MTDEERIQRAQRYASIKPELNDLFDGVRIYLLEEMAKTTPGRPDDILEMHRGLHNLAKLKQAVQAVIDSGQIAQAVSAARLNRD